MQKQIIVLAACLATSLGASAAQSVKMQTEQSVAIESQLSTASQSLIISTVEDKLDFAKQDGLQLSSQAQCKSQYTPYGNAYIIDCVIPLKTESTTLEAKARLVARGTKRGLKDMARFGLSAPSEIVVEYSKFCRVAHLTVTNTQNKMVVLSETSRKGCSNLTTDIN